MLLNKAVARCRGQIFGLLTPGLLLPAGLSAVLLLLGGCASQPYSQMQSMLAQQIQAAGLAPEQVALVVMPLDAGAGHDSAGSSDSASGLRHTSGLRHNADALLQPASTLKLLTSAVALDQLGPLWRGETELLADPADLAQARQDGVLRQPLWLRGKGDPDLDHAAVFGLLQQLYDEGIRELHGGVVLDRSWFQPQLPDPTAAPFDESPRARYNHIPDALGLNQQMLQLRLHSDATRVRVTSLPAFDDLQINPALTLSAGRCDQFDADALQVQEQINVDGKVRLTLKGDFPRQCLHEEAAAWLSRDAQWQLTLSQFWRALGGRFAGKSVDETALKISHGLTPVNATVVAQHFSRPLPQLLQQLNKNSDNGIARILALQLGRLAAADPQAAGQASAQTDTVRAADKVVAQWLSARQLPQQGLVLDNGSGLSRQARISAAQLAALLQYAWQQPWGVDLVSSLPRAGVDGTLQNRLRDSSARDRARLKTGTLRNGTGLAGYVFDRQQRPWIFVALVNAEQAAAKGRPLLNQWVEQVSGF